MAKRTAVKSFVIPHQEIAHSFHGIVARFALSHPSHYPPRYCWLTRQRGLRGPVVPSNISYGAVGSHLRRLDTTILMFITIP